MCPHFLQEVQNLLHFSFVFLLRILDDDDDDDDDDDVDDGDDDSSIEFRICSNSSYLSTTASSIWCSVISVFTKVGTVPGALAPTPGIIASTCASSCS